MKFTKGKGLSILNPDKEFMDMWNSLKEGDEIDFSAAKPGAKDSGSLSMLNTWMMWMGETAVWMAWQGAKMPLVIKDGKPWGEREFKKADAHDLFTSQYLGVDENGKRKTWSHTKNPEETPASMGDKLHALDTHMAWSIEKGIKLTVKKDSEYMKLKNEL